MIIIALKYSCAWSSEPFGMFQRGVQKLNEVKVEGNINSAFVDGVPLVVSLMMDGLNLELIDEYESLGGKYEFSHRLANRLCDAGYYNEAIYLFTVKNVKFESFSVNGDVVQDSCLLTAIGQLNMQEFMNFFSLIQQKREAHSENENLINLIEARIKLLNRLTKK
jgi:hypothetical protein